MYKWLLLYFTWNLFFFPKKRLFFSFSKNTQPRHNYSSLWQIKNTHSDAAPPQVCVCERGEWKVRKPQWTGSPVTDASLHSSWFPPGNPAWIQVRACQRRVELWAAACQPKGAHTFKCRSFVFLPLLQEALHTSAGVKVHTSLSMMHPLWFG